jgi:hypothetical protein
LNCSDNQLSSLDVSGKTALEILYCNNNQFINLIVSDNTLLRHFRCRNNQLSSLDISNNTALTDIDCGGNQLNSLDISNNINLGDNMWESIPDIVLDSMPTLFEVCVWELPFPPEGVEIEITGSPNINFTTECSK